jgi:hypothetical protein
MFIFKYLKQKPKPKIWSNEILTFEFFDIHKWKEITICKKKKFFDFDWLCLHSNAFYGLLDCDYTFYGFVSHGLQFNKFLNFSSIIFLGNNDLNIYKIPSSNYY